MRKSEKAKKGWENVPRRQASDAPWENVPKRMLDHPEVLVAEGAGGKTRTAPCLTWHLLCPYCGDEIEQWGNGDGGDETAVTIHSDRDAYDSPAGTRGGYVEIRLECTSGEHRFRMLSANHKGAQYISIISNWQ